MLNLINGNYICPRRLGNYENSEKIDVLDNEVRCMYRFNQSACLKEKGLCCIVAKRALENPIILTLPKCTVEETGKTDTPRSYMWRERTC